MTQSLADMRRDYTRDGLAEAQAPGEPFALFHQWFADAVKTEQLPVEANAMTLATVDADGRPHCRVLLLKALDAQGFTFFTNYESAKGQHIAARPFAAMTFFWPALERQVRIEGGWKGHGQGVGRLLPGAPAGQPPGGLGVAAEPGDCRSRGTGGAGQGHRGALLRHAAPLPRALGWLSLLPERIEFWQGRASRLHDRLNYRLVDGQWQRERLAP
jgi:pyridoxamine 5'-phosphate oxidase